MIAALDGLATQLVVARSEPGARGRLLRAALELFAERGYDATTSAQIASHP